MSVTQGQSLVDLTVPVRCWPMEASAAKYALYRSRKDDSGYVLTRINISLG